ncbi:hypothetical protein FEM41_02060 [Jejubacter calystegiae]|uniref:BRCT domain-containing protein n=1 Tax=Jejubacter calystegiae TaxID=2579935 RepID=A0A4P8YDF2_9ENTR|nr:BRCT domain-containing protein [Jejubacter calystegiae]QCT18509.1 hypothetical protein FEM41_02060 [Jejubacter calystegiae]
MEGKVFYFIYINSRNAISVQAIANGSHNETYIQGVSLLDGEQGKIKTFRKDRVINFFDSYEEASRELADIADKIDSSIYTLKPLKPSSFDIHFTGFKKDTKLELEDLAVKSGMVIRKSVTKSLKLLCYGYNASQKKMDTARGMGIIILNEALFRQFLETGDFTESL